MIRKIGFFALVMMLAVPFSASAIQLTDYTFPDTLTQKAELSGSFTLNSGNQPQTSYNGSAALGYNFEYKTLPQTFTFDATGRLNFEKDAQETFGQDDSREYYDVVATPYFNQYYKDTNFFGYGTADLGYRKQKGQDSADDPYIKIGVGVGYGRTIEATPLAKAMRVIEELKKYNIISVEPSDACYLELARMIDKEIEFRNKYGTVDYEQYWYKELEDILNKEGLLKSGILGVVGVIRVREVLQNEPFPGMLATRTLTPANIQRLSPILKFQHGWKVEAGVGYIASDYTGDNDEDPSLDVSFLYTLPIANDLQFVEELTYSTILGGDIGHSFVNDMGLAYKISDRILWENLWTLEITLPKEDEKENIYDNTLSSLFRYYISNTLSLDLLLSLHHNEDGVSDDDDNDPNNNNDEIEKSIIFGVTYTLK